MGTSNGIVSAVLIPSAPKKELAQFLMRVSSIMPGLHVVDVDVPFTSLCKDDSKLEQVALGREFHISLGRTVPIRVHQIDSIVAMLRQRLQSQRWCDYSLSSSHFDTLFIMMRLLIHCFGASRYWIDFSKWEVFVNDDRTRTFLSLEVIAGGLLEVCIIYILLFYYLCKPWMVAITSIGRIIGSSFLLQRMLSFQTIINAGFVLHHFR